jgi:ribonuclease BN (tRNA processing enzyme)
VKIRILPSSPDAGHLQHLVSFVIDGHLAIDAGCIGFCGTAESQARLTSVLLTHGHLDHVCSLPIFAMNVFDHSGTGVTVHATSPVIDQLKGDLFNGRVWPDFTAARPDRQPLVRFEPVRLRRPFALGGLEITAIPLNHPVPAVGYLVDDGRSAAVLATDTGPTGEIWDVAGRNPRLSIAFIDVAFPDDMLALADESGHLTPSLAREQIGRLPAAVKKIATHLKPAYHDRIVAQLTKAAIPNLTISRLAHDYDTDV